MRTFYFLPEPPSDKERAKWMAGFTDAAAKRTGTYEGSVLASSPRSSISEPAGGPADMPAQYSNPSTEAPSGAGAATEPASAPGEAKFTCTDTSLAGATCHGWLSRQSSDGASWSRIYYVLAGRHLYSFNNGNTTGQEPLDALEIPGSTVDIMMEV